MRVFHPFGIIDFILAAKPEGNPVDRHDSYLRQRLKQVYGEQTPPARVGRRCLILNVWLSRIGTQKTPDPRSILLPTSMTSRLAWHAGSFYTSRSWGD